MFMYVLSIVPDDSDGDQINSVQNEADAPEWLSYIHYLTTTDTFFFRSIQTCIGIAPHSDQFAESYYSFCWDDF